MNGSKWKVYIFFIIFYAILIALSVIVFSLIPNPSMAPEGFFINPGNVKIEWIFAVCMPGVVGTIAGFIGIFLVSPIIIKSITKLFSRKNKVGLVKPIQISNSTLFRKIWIRSIILGFFIGNICYTLATQQVIIEFMRSVNPTEPYNIPDIETTWQLAWIMTIPSTLIIIPIYVMNDSGLVVIKKVEGFQFESANLASKPIYKVIKGFAGISFIYNLVVSIIFWVIPVLNREGFQITIIIQVISPLIAAGSAFPGVLILEFFAPSYRKKVKRILNNLNLNNEIVSNYEFKNLD
jgi:hypothetical protein